MLLDIEAIEESRKPPEVIVENPAQPLGNSPTQCFLVDLHRFFEKGSEQTDEGEMIGVHGNEHTSGACRINLQAPFHSACAVRPQPPLDCGAAAPCSVYRTITSGALTTRLPITIRTV